MTIIDPNENGFVDDATKATFTLSPDYLGSDVDQGVAEATNEAVVTLAQYVNPEDLTPVWAEDGSLDHVVAEFVKRHHVTPELALTKVRKSLKERCEAEMTRLGRISLDVNGDGFEYDDDGEVTYHRLWGVLGHGQIAFTALKTSSPSFIADEREVMAVYYMPPVAMKESQRRFRSNRTTGARFEVSDDFHVGGYLGIVRWFGSIEDATEAIGELRQAVTRIALTASGTALRSDPIRTLGTRNDRDLPEAF